MQVVQQQAFTLIPIDSALSFNQDIFHLQAQHYAIQVAGPYYFPSLKPGWWLICDKQAELSTSGILCMYLVNGLQLILQLVSEAQDHYEFQSLDEQQKGDFPKRRILRKSIQSLRLFPLPHIQTAEIIQPIIRRAER